MVIIFQRWSARKCLDLQGSLVLLLAIEVSYLAVHLAPNPSVVVLILTTNLS